MRKLTNFAFGTLLAAVLIGPAAWVPPDQAVPTGISIAAGGLWHTTGLISVSTTIRPVLGRTR